MGRSETSEVELDRPLGRFAQLDAEAVLEFGDDDVELEDLHEVDDDGARFLLVRPLAAGLERLRTTQDLQGLDQPPNIPALVARRHLSRGYANCRNLLGGTGFRLEGCGSRSCSTGGLPSCTRISAARSPRTSCAASPTSRASRSRRATTGSSFGSSPCPIREACPISTRSTASTT